MQFRPFIASAAFALAATPAAAGGYVAPFPVTPIFASAPAVAVPAPGFTLCGEPVVCAALSQHLHGEGTARYGKRRVDRMLRDMNVLRQTIRAEGTPAIQDAWDRVEECIDFAYSGCPRCRVTHIEGDDT